MAWSTTKIIFQSKEVLVLVLCISKIQGILLIKRFFLHIDCKSTKTIFQENIQELVAQQIFEKWQNILPSLSFEIEFVQGFHNSLPNFLKRKFYQKKE